MSFLAFLLLYFAVTSYFAAKKGKTMRNYKLIKLKAGTLASCQNAHLSRVCLAAIGRLFGLNGLHEGDCRCRRRPTDRTVFLPFFVSELSILSSLFFFLSIALLLFFFFFLNGLIEKKGITSFIIISNGRDIRHRSG